MQSVNSTETGKVQDVFQKKDKNQKNCLLFKRYSVKTTHTLWVCSSGG